MSAVEYGSIEISRGVGQNSVSEGKVFGPDDAVDDSDLPGAITRLTGAVVSSPRTNTYEDQGCLGVWTGSDRDGKQAMIRVWRTERG